MIDYIPIVFCFDANYANCAAVATFSAFSNSTIPLKVYWLVPSSDVEVANLKKRSLSSLGVNIFIKPVDSKHFQDWKQVLHITRGAYLRLLIPETVEEDKIIYLDSDVIVQTDLSPLYSIDLETFAIAGALETAADGQMTNMPLSKPVRYINTGVLVMDLKRLRQEGFFLKCKDIYEKYAKQISWADQCIINKYIESGKKILNPCWNHYVSLGKNASWKKRDAKDSVSTACILHFLTANKPWHRSYPPRIADMWWGYADKLKLDGLTREAYQPEVRIKRSLLRRISDSIAKRLSQLAGLIR